MFGIDWKDAEIPDAFEITNAFSALAELEQQTLTKK